MQADISDATRTGDLKKARATKPLARPDAYKSGGEG
jgi:hypothetical protein